MSDEKLRDKIAIAAMAAIITKVPLRESDFDDIDADKEAFAISLGAYAYADAMLKARQQ